VTTGLLALALGTFVAPAAADGGHLPGFSVADQRVGVAKLPEELRYTFGDIPGVKGGGLPHHGHGPVWFGEVQRPKATIYAAGNRRWVCVSEVKTGEFGRGTSCTTPAGARGYGVLGIQGCGKGAPRHFRIVALLPDGITAMKIERVGGAGGRTLPVIENTLAFSIGRENIVLRGSGTPAAEEFERQLPLAQTAKDFGGKDQGGCSSYIFAEAKKPD
jgi:hypothetical protein